MKSYCLPAGYGEGTYTEKKSRFLGKIWPVFTEAEAREKIALMRKQYHDARHNCWCFLLSDGTVRYGDDGEPQGTAGRPMLEVLKGAEVADAVVVVTRYFGGILLGTGGLQRAYSTAAREALENAGTARMTDCGAASLTIPYGFYDSVRKTLREMGGLEEDTEFASDVTLTAVLPDPEPFHAAVTDLTAGELLWEDLGRCWRALKSEEPD